MEGIQRRLKDLVFVPQLQRILEAVHLLAFLPIYYLILKRQTFVLPHQPEAAVLISPHQKVKSMVHENPFQFLLVSVFPVTISYSDLIPTESIPDLFVV